MNEIYGVCLDGNRLYLTHHGIKGQKWGVRNAEWYPIEAYNKAKGIVTDAANSPAATKAKTVAKDAAVTVAKESKKAAEAYGEYQVRQKEINAQKSAAAQQKREDDFEREKARVLNSGTPGEILKMADKLTNEELQYAVNRNNILNSLRSAEITRTKQQKDSTFNRKWGRILEFSSNIKTFSEPFDSVATAIERYNKLVKAIGTEEQVKKRKEEEEKEEAKRRADWLQRASIQDVKNNQAKLTNKEVDDYWKRLDRLDRISKFETPTETTISGSRKFKNPPEVREAMRIAKAKGWDALTKKQKELLNELR